jgi:hypothetical protein
MLESNASPFVGLLHVLPIGIPSEVLQTVRETSLD